LTDIESGLTPDFDALCRLHPEFEGELRKLAHSHGAIRANGGFSKEALRADATERLLEALRQRAASSSRYVIRNEIGAGAMGTIYRVWDRELRRHIALKLLRNNESQAHSTTDEPAHLRLLRFLDEAQITAQLDHASIVPIHDLGMDEKGRVFFVMKLVRGRDLKTVFDFVKKGEDHWTLLRAVHVIQKVSEAVAFAHARGVIHRDLKPSNIMVGQFGEVYVMDWGLARASDHRDMHDLRIRKHSTDPPSAIRTIRREQHDESGGDQLLTMDGSVLGTPAYMPPEQAYGQLEAVGPHSDIYSIGAMLYHLLAGHMPYVPDGAHISQYTLLNLVASGPPAPVYRENPEAPDELVAICEKAMAREPAQRYASAVDLAADLEAFLGRRPVAARPASLRYLLQLQFERNRKVAYTALAAVLCLCVSAIVFLQYLSSERDRTRRLADASTASVLLAEANDLQPWVPDGAGAVLQWLGRCDDLLSRSDVYQAIPDGAEVPPLCAPDVRKLQQSLRNLVPVRSKLAARLDTGMQWKAGIPATDAEAWRQAVAAIAQSPHYSNLNLSPQTGLLPLGENPRSKLYEFWCPLTGERPQLDPVSGRLLNQSGGMVMVLIPGGSFDMGSPESELGHRKNEEIVHRTVAPFFMSKFETTQGQWKRVFEENPSEYAAGTTYNNQPFTDLNPVECVTWDAANRFVKQLGFTLPTEVQWEYAARAGTTTAYPWGQDMSCLEGRENVLDGNHVLVEERLAPWGDPYLYHAPVGSFAPNGFGLFDMLGNVSEWCADYFYESYREPHDGTVPPRFRVMRGGNWVRPPQMLVFRSASRHSGMPITTNKTVGFRAAREIR
jgi:formylglycine-generating enzyme required for sulfatase activity/serine/threonine protein kinase